MKEVKDNIKKEEERLIDYLTQQNIRYTRGRREVFDQVIDTHGHFTAEELVKHCKTNGKQVSRATIYRCLKEMLEAGIIRETAFGDKHHHFEHVYDEKLHHHAQCVRCHEFLEFPDLGEDKLYEPILEKQKFKVLGHEMHFYGICFKCQN